VSPKLYALWVDIVLAWRMALSDIKQRYRGSTLGPFWLVLSMLVTGASLTIVYSVIFKVSYREYLAYLIVGMSVWIFISGVISDASTCFINAAGLIKNTQIPLSVHIIRPVFRHLIILLHNAIAVLLILPLTVGIHPFGLLFGAIGCVLVTAVLLPYVSIIAFAGARFRDVAQIVVNLLQFSMFLTPIFWFAKSAGTRGYMTAFNPFFHMLNVVRSPVLGTPTGPVSYLVLLGVGVLGAAGAYMTYRLQRRFVAFWV
jgi:ABC-type polysaccharide/polyol phosphate export permease